MAERNPYYWKVDTEGNQLPYMDRIVYQMVADPQVLLLKCMQGEIDLMDQYIATPNNKSVLYDARKQGAYDFYTLTSTEANVMNFIFNLNHNDETKRKLFRNKTFRAALSTALDRQTLIDAVLVGQGAPAQPSIKEGDPLYNDHSPSSSPNTASIRRMPCSTNWCRSGTARNSVSTKRAGG